MISPEVIRDSALGTPGVLAMHPGPHGTAATFSAAGRIWGVRVTQQRIDVHLVADQHQSIIELGRAVRTSVGAAAHGYAGDITIHIEDIASSADPRTDSTQTSSAAHRDEPQTRRTP